MTEFHCIATAAAYDRQSGEMNTRDGFVFFFWMKAVVGMRIGRRRFGDVLVAIAMIVMLAPFVIIRTYRHKAKSNRRPWFSRANGCWGSSLQ